MHALDFPLLRQGFEIAAGGGFADLEALDDFRHGQPSLAQKQVKDQALPFFGGDKFAHNRSQIIIIACIIAQI
jgi:hypothetical protein